jgi:excisionase family DNA binding protein
MPNHESVLMTIAEAARQNHVHPWTLYTAIRLRELECYRVGSARRSIRVSDAQLKAWLDRGREEAVVN